VSAQDLIMLECAATTAVSYSFFVGMPVTAFMRCRSCLAALVSENNHRLDIISR